MTQQEKNSYQIATGIRATTEGNGSRILYWQKRFYVYEDHRFLVLDDQDFNVHLTRILQETDRGSLVSTKLLQDIVTQLKGLCDAPKALKPNSWLNRPSEEVHDYVPLENGILDVREFIQGKSGALIPHSREFFSLYRLPFGFTEKSVTPRWSKFLDEVLPEADKRELLQEWFGYNLTSDTSMQKALMLFGQGANGKSVILTVLRLLVGAGNVSAVPMEAFHGQRTFPLAATDGKLANIVEEIGDSDRFSENKLKEFIGGSLMTVERKFTHPFEMVPTARMTFATNVLPRFRDRSDGTWRRFVFLPMERQYLDPAKQNRDLTKAEYWSDELPGIFLWAMNGLERLRREKKFTEPQASKRLMKEHRNESNPAAAFLLETFAEAPAGKIPSHLIYRGYVTWAKERGYLPLSDSQFGKEITNYFRHARRDENASIHPDGVRSRWIRGLRWITGNNQSEAPNGQMFDDLPPGGRL